MYIDFNVFVFLYKIFRFDSIEIVLEWVEMKLLFLIDVVKDLFEYYV